MPLKVKNFVREAHEGIPIPNLIEAQILSYEWFWGKGLKQLFEEFSPMEDYSGKELELWFLDYKLEEPKAGPWEAKERNASYEASLRIETRLVNKRTGEIKEQEVFLGDFPLMTKQGTFIVNGVERVVIAQLIRSPGVFFTRERIRGRNLFGAKVIPNRGAWLEFETDGQGAIQVKIDRKRKIPASSLLRAFGIEKNQDIADMFRNVASGSAHGANFIEETLKRDPSKTKDEALIEIYRRLRPGDLATVDNARQLFEGMFFNFARYDLSKVGRWKMDQRLGFAETGKEVREQDITKEMRLLKKEDIVAVIKEIIRLNNDPQARPDDIDHLGNRRVRQIGELLQNRLRVGMSRMERIIKDRMSTLDIYTVTPVQLINARPFAAAVKEFFTSSQLSQFMDNENPLAELEHKRRLSAMGPGGLNRERAGFEVRDVQPSHYGRICPIQTPEGPNIGLVGHLSIFARINEFGFIETPYIKVENGKLTKKIHYLNAIQEDRYVIAHAGVPVDKNERIKGELVEARIKGEPGLAERAKIDYIDVSPQQSISVATALIPFLENDDANRALMGSNMQRQAVPCIKPEIAFVGTGIEPRTAQDSGQVTVAEEDDRVVEVDARHIRLAKKGAMPLRKFSRSNQYTCVNQKPIVVPGERVKRGQVLCDGAATAEGQLALGQNILVAFIPWRGANFEDAVVVSERLVKDDRFTSIYIEDFSIDVRETKLGPEVTTPDIPNVGEEKLKDLDEDGIIRIGAEVGPNDILVGKISPKGESDLTAEERLLRAIFGEKARDVKDVSLRLPHGKRGRVINVHIFSREYGDKLSPGVIKQIQIEVAHLRKVAVGDKLAGRHGNKGVISVVLPEENMPFLEDGTPVDVVLNPLGVVSRMNIGQILETHLGWAAKKLGYQAISPALAGAREEDIKQELGAAGLPEDGKVTVYDGFSGKPFAGKVTVGFMYTMKLIHMVEDKIHMRSIGPYSLITQQPLGGKAQFGGQRFGEMEVWALEGYGASHSLQEMLTYKSDDVLGRSSVYESIIRGEDIQAPNVPASFNVLLSEIKSLGLSIEPVEKSAEPRQIQREPAVSVEKEKKIKTKKKATAPK